MLYLEDYLELIEHLPQELRDRFTDIRTKDLQVQNSSEQLKERVNSFFADAKKLKPEQQQCDYEKLTKEYQISMDIADEKVQIATQMHDIMIKLVQRLDSGLEKFKLELEADHAGITEELEKRSLELDIDSNLDELISNHQGTPSLAAATSTTIATLTPSNNKLPSGIKDRRRSENKQHRHQIYQNQNQDNGYRHGRAKVSHHDSSKSSNHNNSNLLHRQGSNQNSTSCRQQASPSPIQMNNIPGFSSSSLSAPASVAGDLNGIETGHYGNNLTSFGNNSGFKTSSNKNHLQNIVANLPFNHRHSALSAALVSNTPHLNSVSTLAMMNSTSVQNKQISTNNNNNLKGNEFVDPDYDTFSRYCLCRQISYGEMVACDNDECEFEWFHYDCVNVTQPPKGKWYCPDCTVKMNGIQQQHHQSQAQSQRKRGRKEKYLFDLINNSLDVVSSKDESSDQSKNIV